MKPDLHTSKRSAAQWLVVLAVILIVGIVMFAVISARSCEGLWPGGIKQPDISITGVSFRDISITTLTADVEVSVHNPNPIGGVLQRLDYNIYYENDGNWVHLISANREEDVTIKADDTTVFNITNQIDTLTSATALYRMYSQGMNIDLKVTGSAWVGIGPISKEMPFELFYTIDDPLS